MILQSAQSPVGHGNVLFIEAPVVSDVRDEMDVTKISGLCLGELSGALEHVRGLGVRHERTIRTCILVEVKSTYGIQHPLY